MQGMHSEFDKVEIARRVGRRNSEFDKVEIARRVGRRNREFITDDSRVEELAEGTANSTKSKSLEGSAKA